MENFNYTAGSITFPDPTAGGNYFCPITVNFGFHARFNRHSIGLSEIGRTPSTKGKAAMAALPLISATL